MGETSVDPSRNTPSEDIGWPIAPKAMLRFEEAEYQARIDRAVAQLSARGLTGILLFNQESMYYLTGYDTMGYITFQCLYLGADGRLSLLTRAPDLRAARLTSIIEEVHLLPDRADVAPADELRAMVAGFGVTGERLGIERDAIGVKVSQYLAIEAAFGADRLVPADDLVAGLRLVKSPAELVFVRKAAALGDAALRKALEVIRPGCSESELLARMQAEVFLGGGDYASSRWIVGTGQHALLVRHFAGHHNTIAEVDQVQLEFGAAYLHYHACLFHTVYVGQASARQRQLRQVAIEALEAAKAACRPGQPVESLFHAYAGLCDEAGLRDCRLNACGYSLGAKYPPSWMDGNLICAGNQTPLEPNMVFFPHMVLLDGEAGVTGCAGETILVTEDGCEGLSTVPHELYLR